MRPKLMAAFFVLAACRSGLAVELASIRSVAGGGDFQGATATAVSLALPMGLALDANGGLYLSENYKSQVYRLDLASGKIGKVAGIGLGGYSGDGGAGTAAQLFQPAGLALDSSGNLFIADQGNHCIRKITPSGIISTAAGHPTVAGSAGVGGPAAQAYLNQPYGLAFSPSGDLYICDSGNNQIKKIDSFGNLSLVAGTTYGFGGDGGPATLAQLATPNGLSLDPAGNALYIADNGNLVIRKVDLSSGAITTVAGTSPGGFNGETGTATALYLNYPQDVSFQGGNFYIADTYNHRIRKVDAGGAMSTLAGSGPVGSTVALYGGDGGPATAANLNTPMGVLADAAGNVYLADSLNNRVRKIDPAGVITTLAGNGSASFYGDGGPATQAVLLQPSAETLAADGSLYVCDSGNGRVRKVGPNGIITTVAGSAGFGFSGDGGPATLAQFAACGGTAVDAAGNLYVSDTGNQRIRMVDAATQTIQTFAGTGTQAYCGDSGTAASACLNLPAGLAIGPGNMLYVAETGNNVVRKIDLSSGWVSTAAGDGTGGAIGDGGPATAARLYGPSGLCLDAAGNLYIADTYNRRVRKISAASGIITTVAGDGNTGTASAGDGGPATLAHFSSPVGVGVDGKGRLFISDFENQCIREVDLAAGTISTLAGNGMVGYAGDNTDISFTEMAGPRQICMDPAGNIYFADTANDRIRKISFGYLAPQHPGAIYSYPNPFRPARGGPVTFVFQPGSYVSVDIYDMAANKVFSLPLSSINGVRGFATWDGRLGGGDLPATGMYFVVVRSSNGGWSNKFTVVR